MKTLLAYHNDPKLKKSVLAQMSAHRKADELVQGYGYWKNGKGCAVGCLIHSNDHAEYETRFGIPRILARLEDRIFEGLPEEEAQQWPEKFLRAIKPGADLSSIWPKFAVFMLVDKDYGVLKFAKTDKTKKAIQDVANLYQRIINGEKIEANAWLEARRYAYAATNAATNAASAAYDAYAAVSAYADADVNAAYDAYAAATDAASAAYATYAAASAYVYADVNAAYDAAASAASAAYAAAAAYAAYADADADADAASAASRSHHYVALANKLIELLKEAA